MNDSNLLNLHKRVYEYTKSRALDYEGKPSREMTLYRNDQKYYSNRNFTFSNLKELTSSICNSNVIYIGDFHTLDQSTRNFKRIINVLLKNKKKFVLGLEMLSHTVQEVVDLFMSKKISENTFLKSVNYQETWNFPWNNYKDIFKLAIKEDLKIIALNSEGTLKERDDFASLLISEHIENNPQIPILILFGELHIIPNKLPKDVILNCKASHIRQTIIHQNLDQVYWKLIENNLTTDIIKFNNYEFNLQTSPPWLKYESMAYWYENIMENHDLNFNEYINETEFKPLSDDTTEHFQFVLHQILNSLDLKIRDESLLLEYNLYDHTNYSYITDQISLIKPSTIATFYKYLFTNNFLFKLPNSSNYYCPNYSPNRLSYLAGIHLFTMLNTNKELFTKYNNTQKYIYFTLNSFWGYLSSKIINPNRKCDLYKDLMLQKENPRIHKNEVKIIELTLSVLDEAKPINELMKGVNIKNIFNSATYVGHIMAENAFRRLNNIPMDLIKKFTITEEYIHEIRSIILADNEYKNQKKRIF